MKNEKKYQRQVAVIHSFLLLLLGGRGPPIRMRRRRKHCVSESESGIRRNENHRVESNCTELLLLRKKITRPQSRQGAKLSLTEPEERKCNYHAMRSHENPKAKSKFHWKGRVLGSN